MCGATTALIITKALQLLLLFDRDKLLLFVLHCIILLRVNHWRWDQDLVRLQQIFSQLKCFLSQQIAEGILSPGG